jgi:hypothetical protein
VKPRHFAFSMSFVVLLDCSGEIGETGRRADADAGSPDALAPAPCDSTGTQPTAASTNDSGVPLNHRAAPACCPAQRGPAPSGQPYPTCMAGQGCASNVATTCSSDSECTSGANGRCFPFEGLVGPGGCSYDECFTDSNCGSKTPCVCRSGSTDTTANVCDVGSNCAVDADCGPGGFCSPSVQGLPDRTPNVCWGSRPYFCHTASDLCVNDSDCGPSDAGEPTPGVPGSVCAYNPQDSRWECTMAGCFLP